MFYRKSVLGNGITVITEHMDAVRSVALGFWMRVGNRDETPELAGMSHFMEHMLFKGTPTRSALDISMAFDALGAESNAFTSREYTCFYARMLDEHLAEAFEVLSDMLVNSTFAADAIETEREVVIEEIARGEDTPEDRVYDLFADALFPTHPLGRPVLGSRETVSGFDTDQMRAYHDARYTTGNLTVVACGNVSHEDIVTLAEKYLSDMRQGPRLERSTRKAEPAGGLVALPKDTEQAHILYGMPALAQDDPRRYAYALLDVALGGGMSSRLFQEIREKRGLVYSVYTSTQLYEDNGAFAMYAGTRPENVAQVVEVARAQFADVAAHGISDDELHRARELACGNFALGMESARSHMLRLGRLATVGLPLVSVDEVIKEYRSVTAGQVARAARELLAEEPTIAIISPYTQDEIERMV